MSDDELRVSADELKDSLSRILAVMERRHGDTFELSQDLFWDISPDLLYDFSSKPTEIDVGALSDSLEYVKRAADPDSEPITYTLVWLADVLRAIGSSYT